MPRPHHLALFSLAPVDGNERAARVVAHPDNIRHVSTLPSGEDVLDIGFHIRGKSSTTLATLGRGIEADIYVKGSSIAKIQCSFEIDLDSGFVMLYDRSFAQSTQVFGENATPFEHGRVRKVLVQENLNTIIGMGGERRDLYQFELIWHTNTATVVDTIKSYKAFPCGQMENPRLSRTVDEAPTDLTSQRETRPHTAGQQQLKMRYVKVGGGVLGSGQFGQVFKAINVDSGKFMAVKILKDTSHHTSKREVETLSNISHPHIVDYIASQGWGGPEVEIFMGLKEGNLGSLVGSGADAIAIADSAFPQILQALDHIAVRGIIHRDVKPENILYTSQNGRYRFQLGDFGICNRAIDAKTHAGSKLYMAPEMFQRGGQTPKLDVWSLFVTMLWVLDVEGFRWKSDRFDCIEDVREAVLSAASVDLVSMIREMAIVNPAERASAGQMLVKCFDGVGLSTPLHRIPALASSAPPGITAARAPPPTPPSSATWTAQTRSRGLRMNANIFAAAAPYRVRKAGSPLRRQPFRQPQEARPKP